MNRRTLMARMFAGAAVSALPAGSVAASMPANSTIIPIAPGMDVIDGQPSYEGWQDGMAYFARQIEKGAYRGVSVSRDESDYYRFQSEHGFLWFSRDGDDRTIMYKTTRPIEREDIVEMALIPLLIGMKV